MVDSMAWLLRGGALTRRACGANAGGPQHIARPVDASHVQTVRIVSSKQCLTDRSPSWADGGATSHGPWSGGAYQRDAGRSQELD